MATDLYIDKFYKSNCQKYDHLVTRWIRKRDEYIKANKHQSAKKAQAKVELYHEQIFANCYFCDSYNPSNLLWMFDLDWSYDMREQMGYIDDNGVMSPQNAKRCLNLLAEKEPIFYQNLKALRSIEGCKAAQRHEYFLLKYQELSHFLTMAIEHGEPIRCSI